VPIGEVWHDGRAALRAAQSRGEPVATALRELLGVLDAAGVTQRSSRELCRAARDAPDAVARVISPCPGFDPDQSLNDNSLVLRLSLGAHAALLTGDAEAWAEGRLGAGPEPLAANFLKVGHHGSRTSTTRAFLDLVSPDLAAISCGIDNRFGHPHAETLASLEALGVPWLRLDRSGSVEWQSDGERQSYRSVAATPVSRSRPQNGGWSFREGRLWW
jgi:competence protein ComEC